MAMPYPLSVIGRSNAAIGVDLLPQNLRDDNKNGRQSRFKSTVEAQQVEAWESWQPTAQLPRLKAVRFADTLAAIWRSPEKSRDTLVLGGCWIFSLIQNHSSLRPSRHFWNSLSRPRHRLPNFKAGNLLRRIMPLPIAETLPNNLPASVLVEKRNRSGSVP